MPNPIHRFPLAARRNIVRTTCLVTLLFGICLARDVHGQTWSGGGNTDRWSNADNWVGGTLPQNNATSSVSFNDSASQFSSFQDLESPLFISGIFIDTDQTFTFEGQSLSIGTSSSGTVEMNGTGTAIFNNSWQNGGQLNIRGTGGVLILNGNQTGNGDWNIERDFTMNGNFLDDGDITVAQGSTLTLNGGASDDDRSIFLEGSTLGGSGISASRVIGRASGSVLPTIRGGDGLRLDRAIVDGTTLRFTNGLVEVSDSVDFGADGGTVLVKSGAILGGAGSTSVSHESQTITIEAGGSVAAEHTIVHGASVVIDGNVVPPGFLNGAGDINGEASLFSGTVSGELSFNGLVTSSGVRFEGQGSGLKFNNTNDITGEVLFLGNIQGDGDFNISSTAIFDGAETGSDLTMNVSGTLGTLVTQKVEGTIDAIINSTINLNDGATIDSSDTTFAGIINSADATTWNAGSGTNLDGQLNVNSGVLSVTGVVNGTGTMTVADGADIDLLSGAQMNLETAVQGTLTDLQTNAQTTLQGGTLDGDATIDNNMFVNTTEASFLDGTIEVTGGTEVQDGTLEILAASTFFGAGDVVVQEDAILAVQGLLDKDVNVEADGRLRGIGDIIGNVSIDGTLDPGNSAGRLEIDGDVTLTDVSMTDIEIGGDLAGIEHDQVLGNGGNMMLGGRLEVSLLDDFIPDEDDEFVIFDNFTYSGTFSNIFNGRIAIAGVGSFAISFGAGDGNSNFSKFAAENGITFSDFQAVPEPGCATLLAGLMLGMLVRRKRTRDYD